MAFLKQHIMMIAFAVVCLVSAGAASWAYLAGSDVVEEMRAVDKLRNDIRRKRGRAYSPAAIEARKKQVEARNAELSRRLETVLALQKNSAFHGGAPRTLLVPDALPEPKSNATAIDFREAYKREFPKLVERLNGRDKPTDREVAEQQAILEGQSRRGGSGPGQNPWMPEEQIEEEERPESSETEGSLLDFLRNYARARAAEKVARSIRMYVDRRAITPHSLAVLENVPKAHEIWQAQMSLWIEQDLVAALARVNEARVKELEAQGRPQDAWVAHMPVKRLKWLRLRGWFGKGGAVNPGRFARSFTGEKNDTKKFIIPVQLDLVVEEASVARVIESLCGIGFYTPINVDYYAVDVSPLQDDYIYGEAPVVRMVIDLEGYFFRKVFDPWIPKSLKKILTRPGAKEERSGR